MSTDLSARRTALLAYAQSCLEAGDYHGCRDACVDLEVLDARLQERTQNVPLGTFDGAVSQNTYACPVCGQPTRPGFIHSCG